ncbi:MAG: ornithine cyclodeaminase family protein [Candidatus Aminicenantes bacterium]|nr:ornithine cyclodeaminase family protein [Candidatus Aminicenantes bacterium]
MLILNQKDLLRAVSREDTVDCVEKAVLVYEDKNFHMPDRMCVEYGKNSLLLMPCFTKKSMGTKLVSLFPENERKNMPVLFGVMVLNDGETGKPLAVLNGSALTALRTGAVGGAGIRHMTSKKVKTLGIVGAGVQGFHQAVTACTQRQFETVYVYDKFSEKAYQLCKKLSEALKDQTVIEAKSSEELLADSDVLITATTSSEPVLPDEAKLFLGKHVVGIGSYKPDMREFPKALYTHVRTMAVDTEYALVESGDVKVPLEKGWIRKDQIVTLGKIISGKVSITPGGEETTVFKSVGMALFDLMVSGFIYKRAVEKGIGREVVF